MLMRTWSINWIYNKNNESLAGSKMKNEIEELLLNYKHGNNIHEHRQQNEWAT